MAWILWGEGEERAPTSLCGPTASGADGQPTTGCGRPRAWVTPIVRVAAAIIGPSWLTTRNWASPAGWRSGPARAAPRGGKRSAVEKLSTSSRA